MAVKDRKPRKSPFEIDKANLTRLLARIEVIGEARTQDEVKKRSKVAVFETIGNDCAKAEAAISLLLKFFTIGDCPPDQGPSDE